jgi:hypothetical protein
VFGAVLGLCARAGLVSVNVVAVDGSKVSANASREIRSAPSPHVRRARMLGVDHRGGGNDAMRIEVHKDRGTRYRSKLYRADGVVIALEGGSWNRIGGPVGRVPHDLAHLVVEQRLGLARGLWGVLAAGGLVQNAEFVVRRPPHAQAGAQRIADSAGEELRRAEVLVRALADATLADARRDPDALRRAVGPRWWHPGLTATAVDEIDAELRSAALAWDRLAPAASLARTWRPPRWR